MPGDLIDAWTAAWNSQKPSAIAALYAEDAQLVHPLFPEPLRGRRAIEEGHVQVFQGWDRTRVDVNTVVASPDWTVFEWHIAASNTGLTSSELALPREASGRSVEFDIVSLFQLDSSGDIRVERRYFDALGALRQMES